MLCECCKLKGLSVDAREAMWFLSHDSICPLCYECRNRFEKIVQEELARGQTNPSSVRQANE